MNKTDKTVGKVDENIDDADVGDGEDDDDDGEQGGHGLQDVRQEPGRLYHKGGVCPGLKLLLENYDCQDYTKYRRKI